SVDDLVAAARFLVDQRYTRTSVLAVMGSGHGGLVAGGLLTQHPELVAGAVIGDGLLDMSRYDQRTVGWMWKGEYGSAVVNPVEAASAPRAYPPTLVSVRGNVTLNDEEIPSTHGRAFAAALAAAQKGSAPVLLRTDGGQDLNRAADQLVF